MRQRLGPKKIAKYREITGLDIVSGLVRGGTDHRVDLKLSDGSSVHYFPDGTWYTTAELEAKIVADEREQWERLYNAGRETHRCKCQVVLNITDEANA